MFVVLQFQIKEALYGLGYFGLFVNKSDSKKPTNDFVQKNKQLRKKNVSWYYSLQLIGQVKC